MDCPTRSPRCFDQGYCNCHEDRTAEAAGGCGGILILMVAGIFAAFLYPAIRIFRSNIEYEPNGCPRFSGAVWLFTSPLFGFLANMLYQVIFALGAGAVNAIQSKLMNSVYIAGMFLIYALAMGLAVIAFLIRNREAMKLFATKSETRTIGKLIILCGLVLMVLLTIFAVAGIIFAGADGYFTIRSGIQNAGEKEQQIISTETAEFDSYIGKYKFITRSNKELFVVTKNGDGTNLRLNMDGEKTGKTKNNSGCLLTPKAERNSIYYAVSNCLVNGKQSPLAKVYFKIENNKTKMNFIYNTRASGDTLLKIK